MTKKSEKIKNFSLGMILALTPSLFCDIVLNKENNMNIIEESTTVQSDKQSLTTRNHTAENSGKLFLNTDGYDVYDFFRLGEETADFLWSNVEGGFYRMWNSSWKIPQKYGTIKFKAIANDNITIGISRINPWSVVKSCSNFYYELTNSENFYEIVIGGWDNNQSVIRQGAQNDPVTAVEQGIFNQNMLIEYMIVMRHNQKKNKDVLAVYFFHPINLQWQKIMSYNGSFFADGPRWFSFSSWENSIFYTDLFASTETILPK